MTPEQYQRSYLLPPGCKDLIDVLRLQELQKLAFQPPSVAGEVPFSGSDQFSQVWNLKPFKAKSPTPQPEPVFFLEVKIEPTVTVSQLATLLGRKPFQVQADLMELGVFASIN